MRRGTSTTRTLIATALSICCLSACSRHHRVVYTPDVTSRELPAARSTFLDYDARPIDLSNHDLDPQGIYDVRHFSYASAGENGQAGNMTTGHYFKSRTPGKKPLIVVLPIWGSFTYPSTKIGEMIRKQSAGAANVFVMEGADRIVDWEQVVSVADADEFTSVYERMAERFRIVSIDVRRFLDWAETRPDVDPERIGLIGFSVGAVVAAVVAPHDPRISSTVLVLGGGRPGDVLTYCDGNAENTRKTLTRRLGWTVDEYRERLTDIFRDLDPVNYAAAVDPQRVIVFDAARDNCFPRAARDDLWEALGRPQRITLSYSHRVAFLAMTPLGGNFLRKEIWAFLDRTLLAASP